MRFYPKLQYRVHALKRMFEREISDQDIQYALTNGDIIEEYPSDIPYPSCLVLGKNLSERPLHIVLAQNNEELTTIIITIYEPDSKRWDATYKLRRIK